MTDETIRIGVIGAGKNTCLRHIPNLQKIEGVEVVEVANRTPDSARKVADRYNIPVVRNTWQEVATSPNVDAIVIGTWPYLHCEATCVALESHKHVLCEARMAMTENEARKMLKMSYKHPTHVAQIVPSPFTLGIDQTVIDMLDRGDLGKALFFEFKYQTPPSTRQGETLHWRRNRKYSGKNIMVLGIIYETLLRWFGPAKWVSAQAAIMNDRAIDPDQNTEVTIEIPDYLNVQLETNKGLQGTLLINEVVSTPEAPSLKIFGDKGTLIYEFKEDGNLYLVTPESPHPQQVEIPEGSRGRWRVEEEFIGAIRDEEEVEYTTFTTGVEYMKFTEAVNQSIDNNGDRFPITSG